MDSSQDLGSSGGGVHEALAAGEVRLSPGHRVGRYTVRRLIGVGGMGCVYEADDVELSRVVALKVLRHQGRAADHNSARLRLLREGQAMARLSHPNVVPVYGVDSVDGMVFIAMEYVAGETLRSWLRDTSRTWQEILDVVLQAGAGLAAAHAEGIIHRDFKPGNVLVGADGRARVMDFGLARGQDSPSGMVTPVGMHATADFLASQPITKAGAVVGTPAYMAPEQHFGRTADGKSDQFAFSVTLYEALFRRRPFPEDRGFRGLARAKDRGEIIRPPRSAGVPRWLGAAVMRGLAARKVDRFASMTAMLSFLRRRRRRRLPLVLGGAGALLVAGGVGATVLLQDDPCDAGLERVDALWSTAERDRVFAALRAGEGSHAAETFDRVTAQLDGWAARWRTAYTDACRGPQSAAVEETVACLGRSRAALAAAVQTLSQPGPGLVDAAVAVASSLPSADRCQRPTGPEIAAPAEEIRAEVDAIASTLAEAEVLEVAGRFADGLALAEDAVSAAEAVGYEPVLARALRLQGNLLERGGKREAAAAVLERAYVTAVSAGDDRTAHRSILPLCVLRILGLRQKKICYFRELSTPQNKPLT
ncbi:MAG: serine/threonine-protein kinase, partial [Myxococcota bacterium]